MTYFCLALDPPLDETGRKTTTLVRNLEYFIHTKFHQNPSSGSEEEVENVNSLTDDGRRTDGRTDAGQRVITIGHWSLWLLCPKNIKVFRRPDLKYSIWIFLLLAFWDFLWPLTQCNTQQNTFFIVCLVWKGIRVTMLFDLLTCIMQCCYTQCMIIQCLIFLLQFQFDFIAFHFFFLQSCFRAFDICSSFMQDFHCAMRYTILRSTIIHTPPCQYSYFVILTAMIHPDGASLVQTNFESVPIHRVYPPPPPHREGSEVMWGEVAHFLHWNSRTKCQRYDGITWTSKIEIPRDVRDSKGP